MPTHWIPMPILRLICNAIPTRVVSVHVVSYAYSILCHSYVTYAYSPLSSLPSLLCLHIVS